LHSTGQAGFLFRQGGEVLEPASGVGGQLAQGCDTSVKSRYVARYGLTELPLGRCDEALQLYQIRVGWGGPPRPGSHRIEPVLIVLEPLVVLGNLRVVCQCRRCGERPETFRLPGLPTFLDLG
jgi:hypothetical protein